VSGLPPLGSLRSRVLALGLVLLVIGSLVRFVVLPLWQRYERNREAIQESRYQLVRYRAVSRTLVRREAMLRRLAASDEVSRYTMSEASAALAAAALQEKVKTLVVSSGGRLNSVRVLPTKTEAGFERVTVGVRAQLENEALQRVLYELETARPFLVVENFVVASRAARYGRSVRRRTRGRLRPPEKRLDVSFDLFGLRVTGPATLTRSSPLSR